MSENRNKINAKIRISIYFEDAWFGSEHALKRCLNETAWICETNHFTLNNLNNEVAINSI